MAARIRTAASRTAGSIEAMASPPVLFSSAAFFARPLSWTFQLAAECGYHGVEVMVTKDPESQDPARIRALAEEFGLTVGALHAPCLLLTRKVWGTDPIGKIDRSVEAAADAGIPVVVVHPPYRWQRAFRRWLIDDLPSLEERTGVAVAVENMFPVRLAGRDVTFHSNQDLEAARGPPPPRARHVPRGRREARPDRGPEALRGAPATRAPLRQRREGMGLPPAARGGRARSRPASWRISPRRGSTARCRSRSISDLRSVTADALATTMIGMRERTERALASAGRPSR